MPAQQADATVTKLSGKAYAERNGTRITLSEGSDIFASDAITTEGGGGVEFVFRDDSVIKLGPNSHVAVQDFVFDGESNPSFAVNLASGVMGYISGKVVEQNPAAFKISTPRATVGIRGTETYHSVNGETETHAVVYIAAGHIVLLTSSDGQAISLGSAMQAVTLHAGNTEPLTIRSFESSEMDKLQNALRDMNRVQQDEEAQGPEQSNQEDQAPSAEESVQQEATTVSTVVQDEIRVVIVAEDGNVTLTELVQGALESLPGTTVDTLLPSAEVVQTLSEAAGSAPSVVPEAPTSGATQHPEAGEKPVQPDAPNAPNEPVIPGEPDEPDEPDTLPGNSYERTVLTDTLTGGDGNDTFTIGTLQGNGRIEGLDGDDVIYIDASTVDGAVTPSVDGGGGTDALHLGDQSHVLSVENVEKIYGGSGNDSITVLDAVFSGTIATGTGNDSLTLTGSVTGGSIDLGAGADILNIDGAMSGGSIDLGAGADILNISGALTGGRIDLGAGDDVVNISGTMSGNSHIDLGEGKDVITISALTGGRIDLGEGNDIITISASQGGTVDGGGGSDSLQLGDHSNVLTVVNVETVKGGSQGDTITILDAAFAGTVATGAGDDSLTLTGAVTGGSIDLGGGSDTLQLGDQSNDLTVTNVETIYGGSQGDSIRLDDGVFSGTVATGDGNDSLTMTGAVNGNSHINLGAGDDTASISGAVRGDSHIDLGEGNDSLVIDGVMTGGRLDLGAGNDTVTISGALSGSSVIDLGEGNDIMSLGTMSGGTINLGDGNDSIGIGKLGAVDPITIYGGSGNDTITINDWDNGTQLRVILGEGDILQLIGGTALGGVAAGDNWEQIYKDASSHGLTVIFEGINTQAQYDALVNQHQITFSS